MSGGLSELQPADLAYDPVSALDYTYDLSGTNVRSRFGRDAAVVDALGDPGSILGKAQELMLSPHWEDRLRAETLRRAATRAVTLPDGFPCIYEPADSARRAEAKNPASFVWVTSPDESMLVELLPLYRELWAAYEAQWTHSPSRTFVFGRLDGVQVHRVYRPGTTAEQVIGSTMLTHTDMYRTAPEHLKRMHPLHNQWTEKKG